MYKDIATKISFHKERIIKEFIKKGIYPNDKLIAERMSSIDTGLSYLQPDKILPGEYFDVPAYNTMIDMLWRDLELLYKLLYEITIKEYTTLRSFVDTHLDELESIANKYKLKAEQEVNSTSLGKTILFKSDSFDLHTQNAVTVVDLGEVKVNKGSRVACYMNANNIEPEKIVFGFKQGESEPLYVSAYNYNQDSIVIPGQLEMKSYTTTFPADQILSGPAQMNLGDNKASENNSYVILAGKNKMLVKKFDTRYSQIIQEVPTNLNMASFDKHSYIDFYVVGGSSITFRFNKKPISTNFPLDNYRVENLNHIHHFFIECEAGFSFDFELGDGGDVYAIKERGTINNEKLYFSRSIEVRDFLIEEYKVGQTTAYHAFVKVINDDGDPVDIESVMIKELLSIGGDV